MKRLVWMSTWLMVMGGLAIWLLPAPWRYGGFGLWGVAVASQLAIAVRDAREARAARRAYEQTRLANEMRERGERKKR
jgi:hypothetical protein